jgi:regulator of sigma E protease
MIVVLGIMILVHEFGHFAVAKLLGVRVEQFALGFGKRLLGFRRGDTDYRINLLPFGGYVKMAGENPSEARTGDPGEFTSHPRWHRFLIAVAGPAMNILLAVALLTAVYMLHYTNPAYLDQPAVVGYVIEDSPAAKAGIQEGDRIVRIESQQNPTWEDVGLKIALNPGHPVNVAVQRGSAILDKTLVPVAQGENDAGEAGLIPERTITVTRTEPSMPAAKAGLQTGDTVVAINGRPLRSIEGLLSFLDRNGDKPVELTILRNGEERTLAVTPAQTETGGHKRYRLGFVSSEPVHVNKLPFFKAVGKSLETNKRYSLLILDLVEKMVQRKVSMRQITGPIGIGAAAGEAAEQPGWTPLMALTALISLNLGIFNLLPIPILDGGLILLLVVEAVMRRDISQAVKERIYQAAFVFLLLIGAIVIYNDLARTLPSLTGHLP